MKKDPKQIAELTPQENHSWEFAFTFYLDEGFSQSKADKLTWRDMLLEFPRLKHFAGCR
jgi:hypothetical protein